MKKHYNYVMELLKLTIYFFKMNKHYLYIDKENTILNKITKDNIFKAYESNYR